MAKIDGICREVMDKAEWIAIATTGPDVLAVRVCGQGGRKNFPRFSRKLSLYLEIQSRNANAAVMDAIAAVHRDQQGRDALDNAGHFQRARIDRAQARD